MARKKHPHGLVILFFTEMWERFGYYLMLGIFMLYMTKSTGLGMEKEDASDIYGTFIALVYLMPFFGGLLADRLIGYRISIIFGGILMGCGYLGMAIPNSMQAFYISLLLIAVGNGFFKPCISVLLGKLYEKEEYRELKDAGFNIFYMGINIGAFFCNFVAAYLRVKYDWGYAFAAAGVGMFVGVIWFLYGNFRVPALGEADKIAKPQENEQKVGVTILSLFVPAGLAGLAGWFLPQQLFGGPLLGSAANDAFFALSIPVVIFYFFVWHKASKKEREPIAAMLVIFTVVIVFWAVFHQNGAAITYWTEEYTDRTMGPVTKAVVGSISTERASTVPRVREVKEGWISEKLQGLYGESYDKKYKERFAKIAEEAEKKKAEKNKGKEKKEKKKEESEEEGKKKKVKIIGPDVYFDNQAKENLPKGNLPVYTKEQLEEDPLLGRPSDMTEPEWKKLSLDEKFAIAGRPDNVDNDVWKDLSPEERKQFGQLELWPTELQASINPFYVVVLTPLVVGFFGFLRKHNREPSTPAKIGIGLMIAGISVLIMVAAAISAGEGKSSVAWLFGLYGVITVGELCLSPMGLSLVSKLSPPRIVGVMMGGWFLSCAFGNKLSGVLSGLWDAFESKALFFLVNSLLMIIAAVAIFVLLPWLRRVFYEHEQQMEQELKDQSEE